MPDIEQLLGTLAETGTGGFSIERYQAVGEPVFWEESIRVEAERRQICRRLRSVVDEGGDPIGNWSAPTEPDAVRALAHEMLKLRLWEFESVPMLPGQDAVQWRYRIGKEKGELIIPADNDEMMRLMKLDLIMRRVANSLVEGKQGAMLVCELGVKQVDKRNVQARIALFNPGKEAACIGNPFNGGGANDYLSLDLGQPPVQRHGVTDVGILYRHFPLPTPKQAPWDQPVLLLKPGERLMFPDVIPIATDQYHGFFIRSVYSYYNDVASLDNATPVRGRAFSKDFQLP